jgi:hypothetical protein
MQLLRRAASAFLALWLLFGAFSATPAPVRAEDNGAGLAAAVFAFDFSGSVFCYKDGSPDPSCKDAINEALSASVNALADEIENNAGKYTNRKFDFLVSRFGSASKGSVEVCRGNTETATNELVSCLRKVSQLYLDPSSQLGGTSFVPELQELDQYSNSRCGLILFTDGTPDDKKDALELAKASPCAILPVSTGTGEIDQTYLRDITSTDLASIPGCSNQDFMWSTVYFESAADAADAIGRALDKVACLEKVPAPACMNISEYQAALEALGFVVTLGSGVDGSQFPNPSGIEPIPGTRLDKGQTITITSASSSVPSQCVQPPEPTEPPPPPPPPAPPCVADGPLSWLGCNPWWLLLLLGLIVARLLWIRREIEVSVNGKSAVGLGSGPWNGFDVYSGDARMNLNPRAESIQIHRSFVRSARYEDCRTAKTLGTKIPLRMDEEVTLQDGLKFVAGYGSGGRASSEGGRVSQGSSTGRKASGEATSSEPKEYKW